MIICSCNVLTTHDVAEAVEAGATRPREVYAAKGCKVQCGSCVTALREVLKEFSGREGHLPCGRPYCARQASRATLAEPALAIHPAEMQPTA